MKNEMNRCNKIFLEGIAKSLLGIFFATSIWFIFIKIGAITRGIVYGFALSIAIGLSGLTVLITGKSFSNLSSAWANLSGFIKLLLTISISVFLYFCILIIGVTFTR